MIDFHVTLYHILLTEPTKSGTRGFFSRFTCMHAWPFPFIAICVDGWFAHQKYLEIPSLIAQEMERLSRKNSEFGKYLEVRLMFYVFLFMYVCKAFSRSPCFFPRLKHLPNPVNLKTCGVLAGSFCLILHNFVNAHPRTGWRVQWDRVSTCTFVVQCERSAIHPRNKKETRKSKSIHFSSYH